MPGLGLKGHERYTIDLPSNMSDIRPGQDVTVHTHMGKQFTYTLQECKVDNDLGDYPAPPTDGSENLER